MRGDIELVFNAHIRNKVGHKKEVCKWLINHERKSICIDKLCEQIFLIEKKARVHFSKDKYKLVIHSICNAFMKTCLAHKTGSMMTQAQKDALTKTDRDMTQLEGSLNEEKAYILKKHKDDGIYDLEKENDDKYLTPQQV